MLVALTLTGCETTEEKSAKLERAAKHDVAATTPSARGLSIAHQSAVVKVLDTTVVHSSEGTAAVVTLRNTSPRALRDIPLAITVHGAGGSVLYTNAAPGLAPSLVSAPLLAAGGELSWVDDQVQASGAPVSVSAEVGEGAPVAGSVPSIALQGTHQLEEGSGSVIDGTVVNHSAVAQKELVVYALARRAGRVVAAGRAVVPVLAPASSSSFQIYLIGSAKGAQLQLSAPASTVG